MWKPNVANLISSCRVRSMQEIINKATTFLNESFIEHGIKIILIIGGTFLAQIILKYFIGRVIRSLIRPGNMTKEAEEKRENTLIQVLGGTMGIVIWIISGMTILSELGVAIGPILAAAGIAGVAIGFGGQYLIRDVITGLFILLENQYRVGDVVCFDTTCGSVEQISLRLTVLRDLDGTVHHVPHGEVKKVANLSKLYARINLDVGVAYDTDIEKLTSVVNRIGQELADDPVWKDYIMEAPVFVRITDFADSAIMIKILGKVKPLKQWEVTGELRRRIKIEFDKEGIVFPFPQRDVHMVRE